MIMDTELGFYAATFRYGHGQLFVGGGAFFSLFASFPFISACFFSGNFRFTHEQQKKLEDINGGILTYGYAVEVIIRDVSTLYPLIWRGS
jgi:hypothetical protein